MVYLFSDLRSRNTEKRRENKHGTLKFFTFSQLKSSQIMLNDILSQSSALFFPNTRSAFVEQRHMSLSLVHQTCF